MKIKRSFYFFAPVFVFVLAICLRFYRVLPTYIFTSDEELVTTIASNIVKNFHILWIGVNAADTGFYMGPLWIYVTAFWLFLGKGDPAITAYVGSTIGVLTTTFLYFVVSELFNKKTALISTLLYATLPFVVYWDKRYWDPSLTSILSLAIYYVSYKFYKGKDWWFIPLTLLYGLIFHIHLSLVPLLFVSLVILRRRILNSKKTIIIVSIAGFLLSISPMLVFDYFHKGTNILTPLRVEKKIQQYPSVIDPFGHFKQLFSTLGRVWYLSPNVSPSDEMLHSCSLDFTNKDLHIYGKTTNITKPRFFISLFAIGVLVLFLLTKKNRRTLSSKLLIYYILSILIAYILLPNSPLEYYLLGFYPLYLIIPGIIFTNLKGLPKIIFVACLLTFVGLGINTLFKQSEEYGLTNKKELIIKVKDIIGSNFFELEDNGLCHRYEGWRYLFKAYGLMPTKSSTDINLGWLYKDEISKEHVVYKVIVNEERIEKPVSSDYKYKIVSGGFSAYIYNE